MSFIIFQNSKQGLCHQKTNTPNQDAVFSCKKNEIGCIALADGAGSRQYADIGAKCASQIAANFTAEHFYTLLSSDIEISKKLVLDAVLVELKRVAETNLHAVKEYASTLLVAATDKKRYVVIHLGDGTVFCIRPNGWNVLSYPFNGEFLYQTCLTTSCHAEQQMQIKCGLCDNITGFALASDGILPLVFKSHYQMIRQMPLQEAFCEISQMETSDDASYITIYNREDGMNDEQ